MSQKQEGSASVFRVSQAWREHREPRLQRSCLYSGDGRKAEGLVAARSSKLCCWRRTQSHGRNPASTPRVVHLGADFQCFEWWWQDLAQRVVQLRVVCARPIPKAVSDPTVCVRGARSSVLLGVILQPLE